jgi:hypothetical protein
MAWLKKPEMCLRSIIHVFPGRRQNVKSILPQENFEYALLHFLDGVDQRLKK